MGLNKIEEQYLPRLRGICALIKKEYAEIFSKTSDNTVVYRVFVVTAYLCCLLMNFHPVINRYLKRFSSNNGLIRRDKKNNYVGKFMSRKAEYCGYVMAPTGEYV